MHFIQRAHTQVRPYNSSETKGILPILAEQDSNYYFCTGEPFVYSHIF